MDISKRGDELVAASSSNMGRENCVIFRWIAGMIVVWLCGDESSCCFKLTLRTLALAWVEGIHGR